MNPQIASEQIKHIEVTGPNSGSGFQKTNRTKVENITRIARNKTYGIEKNLPSSCVPVSRTMKVLKL
ncbi:hypothetical protein NECAME_10753 [Necator americanus]|uniref:Uncharacterized protein n=1 Tax=Necator americanus TaxID=51031 RepID=W2T898_NECAM|nr:hypothetical protein NECAME_10753 [Necator americanus]ETN77829.1 hypothetical protein NECAME_10753 [Necator americanus]